MKILVIGGQGFIGSHCIRYFAAKGHDVWACGLRHSEQANFTQITKFNADFSALFTHRHYDVCINASGSANVAFSFEYPEIDFELNVSNVNKLLSIIKKENPTCKFINLSSAAVYGNPAVLPIKEESPTKPISPYGFHKLQSEYLLTEYANFFGLATCSLRIFSAYGEGIKKQLFWDLYQKSLQKAPICLFGTGNETRDFIHIDDLLQVIELVITKAPCKGEVYNVATGTSTTIREVATLFFKELDNHINFVFSNEQKQGDPLYWQADISALQALGFVQTVSKEEGIKRYVKWLRTQELE
jgi:dTDP-glucose 4,6-dehydratase/UDP-glucose 4-epimerase